MRTTMQINRVQANELVIATLAHFNDLEKKLDEYDYGSDDYYNCKYRISQLMRIQDELIKFICEE